MRSSNSSNRPSNSPLDGLDRRPKNTLEHSSTRIKPADRHGMEWHWLDGSCQKGATVICNTQGGFLKGGVDFVLTIGSALLSYSYKGLWLRPT